MTESELTKSLTYLGLAFEKKYNEQECALYYDFFKNYDYQTFRKAINYIIENNKYLPKISELREACDMVKYDVKLDVLSFMNSKGYFSSYREYSNAVDLALIGHETDDLKKDMTYFYRVMKGKVKMIGNEAENDLRNELLKLIKELQEK